MRLHNSLVKTDMHPPDNLKKNLLDNVALGSAKDQSNQMHTQEGR